ncbi:cysteine--1-D-myo-inosityl 2-amino-2-deoxy-alpha-D-glucopyranoside ligase [Actinoplanes auranticolor]|uniref:L-cysteine:1D-myo-inositol 2-amino-2-deoxy-alpha-D-glucopyranoside ligase n=1 Tax=Actinoplanes auranticolor TaxID=47988 RepID=A0A919VX03_9ACTN|nr:cysteine--1-D-myo-inosityl 2-amino-2-deoxy-alpha-D-glucopyranoside ligase [Actinoplanes auranticolor]GIM78897.1 L-cysteine:1D-myo-inositol 2-amino-2-deoxy-alpha-D-glucopyranoside ligase [Actinoplanes auranticolor]
MDAWTGHEVPKLPGTATLPALYDSARRSVQPTTPADTATMYVCGITPYDATHLGHAATMITFDLVQRAWRDAGLDVRYVQNVTDIDDPLLERAARDGEDWVVLAMRETALFREDMEALRMIPPAHYVGAVESIPAIAAHVRELLDAGAAYRLEDGTGDVYFPIEAAPQFGYESHLSRDEMLVLSAERGGDPERPGKRDPLDPLLWRGARDGEPAWDGGDLGPGRPGWHIECATIALALLGETIDVQGGGNDLLYPHHECSAAHAERLTGTTPFARHYVHAGMIGLNGEKMSKSKGNLVFVSRLRADGVDPMAVRVGLLAEHYRTDRQWTDDVLKAGQQRLARWREASAAAAGPSGEGLLAAVREALHNDLDTPAALALVDAWSEAALSGVGDDVQAPALMARTVDALLGIRL